MSDPRVMGARVRPLTYTAQGRINQPMQAYGKGFSQTLKELVEKVGQLQATADKSVQDLTVGRGNSLHETMIAVEQAGIAFKIDDGCALQGHQRLPLINAHTILVRGHPTRTNRQGSRQPWPRRRQKK